MARNKENALGGWAFLIGVILAVVLGLGLKATETYSSTIIWVLIIVGIIVGLLNVSSEEATPFLMSGVVLVIVANFGSDALSEVKYVGDILNALLVLFVPATIVVAIRNVFGLARR